MGVFNTLSNAVTFGGHARLQEAQANYQEAYSSYQEAHQASENLKADITSQYAILGDITSKAFLVLERLKRLLGHAENDWATWQHQATLRTPQFTTQTARELLSTYHSVEGMASGAGLGTGVAIGSWALVSMLGTASTGTAIASLSGAAAFNATLAWFGGGAIAAGGAGMAGGSLILGGFVAVPFIAFASWKSHSKAKELVEEALKVRAAQTQIEKTIPSLRQHFIAAQLQTEKLTRAFENLCSQCEKIEKVLFPLGLLSKLWRSLRGLSGFGYFLITEAYLLSLLNDHVNDFVHFFIACQTESYETT